MYTLKMSQLLYWCAVSSSGGGDTHTPFQEDMLAKLNVVENYHYYSW